MQILTPSATIILDSRRKKKTGLFPVKLRVTFAREQKYFRTGIDLNETDFSLVLNPGSISKDILPARKKKLLEHKFKLDGILVKANQVIINLPNFSLEAFEQSMYSKKVKVDNVYALFEKVINAISESGRHGTAGTYTCSLTSLKLFKSKLEFKEVTPKFLHDFETWFKTYKKK